MPDTRTPAQVRATLENLDRLVDLGFPPAAKPQREREYHYAVHRLLALAEEYEAKLARISERLDQDERRFEAHLHGDGSGI